MSNNGTVWLITLISYRDEQTIYVRTPKRADGIKRAKEVTELLDAGIKSVYESAWVELDPTEQALFKGDTALFEAEPHGY